jgi:hypothetical protein
MSSRTLRAKTRGDLAGCAATPSTPIASQLIATHVLERPPAPEPASNPRPRLHWWLEIVIIAAFYGLYSWTRDIHGNNKASIGLATRNAHRIIRLERDLHVFQEARIQHFFIHDHAFLSFWDDYYASVHFVAVIGVLLWLFFRRPVHYRFWRNTLAVCTGLALIGFTFFPVLPPRLLPPSYHIVDTLSKIGGLWNFSSGPVNDVSNQFAAMPSLHTGWSTWCALAIGSTLKNRWAKGALFLYPAATIFCIVVTGNHYFSDAAGGLITLGVSYLLVRFAGTIWRFGPGRFMSGRPRWLNRGAETQPLEAPSLNR